jgi:hypothetical protein
LRFIFHYAECLYAECRYAECHYAEWHNAEWHNAEWHNAECRYAECHSALSLPVSTGTLSLVLQACQEMSNFNFLFLSENIKFSVSANN